MEFVQPMPFEEAIRKLGSQPVVGSTFSSGEWGDVPVELRDNAFFSSRIESAQFLQRAKDALGDYLSGAQTTAQNGELMLKTGSRAAFVSQMQDFLASEGVVRTTGHVTDIAGEKRLGLIFDIKTQQAQDFGYWKQGMRSAVLNAFPAQRFIRVKDVKTERELHIPYQDQVYLKTDPIWWRVINKDFGVPWGPWGWGCGHDVEDVDRAEAERLSLIKRGEVLKPLSLSLNHNLQASVKNLDPELVEKLRREFGDRIAIEGDSIRWVVGPPRANVSAGPALNPPPKGGTLNVPRQSPVSDALDLQVRGDLKAQVNAAVAAIDEVHDDGLLPQIPLKSTARSYLGYFQPQMASGLRGITAKYIAVRGSGNWPALTAVHEVGHFLDLDGIGTKGMFATVSGDKLMAEVLQAAEQTAAIRALRAHRASHFDEGTRYLLKPEEIWARAYAQYIATRSSSALLKGQLAKALGDGFWRQWEASDFEIIAAAMDKMFKKLGWL